MKLNAGEVGRTDVFHIAPEELILVEEDNSRQVSHTKEQIESLANSLIGPSGQLQPILARRLTGAGENKVKVVAGFGRTKAALYVNKVLRPDNPIKLLVRVLDMSPEEALVRSIEENIARAETTPIDDAYAQRKLREFGWSEQKIADFYQKSVAYIGQLRKTLELSTDLKQEIIEGNLPISAAITLTEIPEEERAAVVAEAKDGAGKVNTETINRKVRDRKIEQGKGKGRSLKEIKAFFEATTGPAETLAVRELSKKIVAFIAGKISDKVMTNALQKNTLADPEQAEAA